MNREALNKVADRTDDLLTRSRQVLDTIVASEQALLSALDSIRCLSDHIVRCNRRHKPTKSVKRREQGQDETQSDEDDEILLDHIAACHEDIVRDLDGAKEDIVKRHQLWLALKVQYVRDQRILTLLQRANQAERKPQAPATPPRALSLTKTTEPQDDVTINVPMKRRRLETSSSGNEHVLSAPIGAAQFVCNSDDSTMLSSPDHLGAANVARLEATLTRAENTMRSERMRRKLY